jgi:hypothetical protein
VRVHSALPERLAAAVADVLATAGVAHAPHGDRDTVLRAAGPFDEHGDPVDPPVWLWRPDREWVLRADRAL